MRNAVNSKLAVGALGLLVALTPMVAQAQGIDPALRDTIQTAVTQVGRWTQPGASVEGGPITVADLPQLLPGPQPTLAPTPEPVPARPSFDVTDAVAHEAAGVQLVVPSGWDVESDIPSGMLFDVTVPDTDISFSFQDGGEDAPGVAALVMFRGLSDALFATLFDDTVVDLVDTTETDQGLPLTRIQYHGSIYDVAMGGAFYIISTGPKVYILIANGPLDLWPEFSDVLDWMARSVVVADDQVGLVTAEGEDFHFVDEAGQMEVWVPDGWRVSDTGRPAVPVVTTDADYRYTMMLTSDAQLDDTTDLMRLMVMLTAGVDADTVDGLANIVMAAAIPDYDEIQLDAETLVTYSHDGGVTVGVSGDLLLGEGATIPMVVYLDVGNGRLAAALAFGDLDALRTDEETVLAVVRSVAPAE